MTKRLLGHVNLLQRMGGAVAAEVEQVQLIRQQQT